MISAINTYAAIVFAAPGSGQRSLDSLLLEFMNSDPVQDYLINFVTTDIVVAKLVDYRLRKIFSTHLVAAIDGNYSSKH